jgi:hypothetical protein
MHLSRPLFLVFLCLCATPVRATVLQRLDLDTLTRHAEVVVHATVREVFTHHAPGSRAIVTTTTLDVRSLLKGDPRTVPLRGLRLTQPGGTLDGQVVRIPGVPVFAVGQEVVLFLQRLPDGRWGVVGYEQGRFSVERDASGKPLAVRRVRGVGVLDPDSGAIGDGPSEDLRLPLADLFARVRAATEVTE